MPADDREPWNTYLAHNAHPIRSWQGRATMPPLEPEPVKGGGSQALVSQNLAEMAADRGAKDPPRQNGSL